MPEKYLIVVDMQRDFVYGPLGSQKAGEIVPRVAEKVKSFEGTVIFTQDTHGEDYLKTQEGKNLPVKHCIENTEGWRLVEELEALQKEGGCVSYKKGAFGCLELAAFLQEQNRKQAIESIELAGVCTDICVVSNALLIKAHMPEVPVIVDSGCCAGVTPQKHQAALETMRSCQILVL